jgi:hypothetical protein
MTVGQVEHGLMSKLFCVVGSRPALKDDSVLGVLNTEIANSAVGRSIDMAFNELREFLGALSGSGPRRISAAK